LALAYGCDMRKRRERCAAKGIQSGVIQWILDNESAPAIILRMMAK
jgi:hypothetical protein